MYSKHFLSQMISSSSPLSHHPLIKILLRRKHTSRNLRGAQVAPNSILPKTLSSTPLLIRNKELLPLLLPSNFSKRCFGSYEPESDWYHPGWEHVKFLTDKTLGSTIKNSNSLMVMFYAPWCVHCKNSKPEYSRAAGILAKDLPGATLSAIDCTVFRDVYEKHEVIGYPTFKYYNRGKLIGEYHHRRRAMDFVHFMLREPKSRADL